MARSSRLLMLYRSRFLPCTTLSPCNSATGLLSFVIGGRDVGMLPAFAAERCEVDSVACNSSGARRESGVDMPDALGHQRHHYRVVPPETQSCPRCESRARSQVDLPQGATAAGSSETLTQQD